MGDGYQPFFYILGGNWCIINNIDRQNVRIYIIIPREKIEMNKNVEPKSK